MEKPNPYEEKPGDYDLILRGVCPKCKGKLTHARGCAICKKCGFQICEDIAEPPSIK